MNEMRKKIIEPIKSFNSLYIHCIVINVVRIWLNAKVKHFMLRIGVKKYSPYEKKGFDKFVVSDESIIFGYIIEIGRY